MEQLLGGRAGRGKSSAYAAMIKELLHEVEKLSHDNESLKKELSEAKARDGAASERVGALAKERDSLESSLKSQQEQASNKEIMMALEMANKENEISRLHRTNTDLNDQIAKLKEERNNDKNSHRDEISSLKQQCHTLRLTVEQYEEEKRGLLRQRDEKDKLHRLQVEELRKINAIIKENFKVMEEDYDSLLELTEEQPLSTRRQHRPPSRPKKEVIHKKGRAISSSNPQMEEELWRIKRQVSEQMVRMGNSREQAVKGRVDRTLATIESLLTEMSQRVDPSDEQSNNDS